jgi:hypothetical protein
VGLHSPLTPKKERLRKNEWLGVWRGRRNGMQPDAHLLSMLVNSR